MSGLWLLVLPLAAVAVNVVWGVLRCVPRSNEDFVFC